MNSICECGHLYERHCILGENDYVSACDVRGPTGNWADSCLRFKQDNLRFLEELVYEKGFKQYSANKRYQAKKVN